MMNTTFQNSNSMQNMAMKIELLVVYYHGEVVGREVYSLHPCAIFISSLTKLYKLQ